MDSHGTQLRLDFGTNVYSSLKSVSKNVFYNVIINKGISVDGVSYKDGLTSTFSTTLPILLFGSDYGGSRNPIYHTNADVYSLTMWSNSTKANKVLAFVPCQLLKGIGAYNAANYAADLKTHKVGEIGFWDLVTNKFYANGGAGEFTCEFSE